MDFVANAVFVDNAVRRRYTASFFADKLAVFTHCLHLRKYFYIFVYFIFNN